ncbi:MAG: peptidase A24 [Thermoplasmata archaeon]|nr:peptidase A24 [Thermoplasmata archaeon]
MPLLDLLRFVVAVPFFIYASYSDLKERMISTAVWFFLGIFAVIFNVYQYLSLLGIIALLPSIIIFYEWFFEWENKFVPLVLYIISSILFFYALILSILHWGKVPNVVPLLLITILMVIFRVLHHFRVIRGRADARALMTIALLQPTYPTYLFSSFPIFVPRYVKIVQLVFPFTFLVILYAGIFFFIFLISLFIFNLLRGDFGFPEMFMGYRMPLEEVNRHHVWLMERVIDGEHVLYLSPSEHTKKDLESLKNIGRNRVWVQPKIPFIVFLTFGLICAYLIGNFI